MPPFRRFSRVARFALSLAVAAVALPALSYAAPPAQQPVRPIVKSDPSVIDPELAEAIKNAPTSAQWPNNDYARLLDIGKVTVTRDGSIVALYRETYKLFNERAREKAEVSLPYNSAYQAVRVVSARTISKEGKVTVVKSEDIRSASPFSDYLMYDDAMAVGFSLPAIENDCVIDYTYEMITRPMLLPGQFWTYWGFSGPEPVSLCRYELTTPADKPLKFKTYNDDSLKPVVATSADGATKTYVWEKRALRPSTSSLPCPPIRKSTVGWKSPR